MKIKIEYIIHLMILEKEYLQNNNQNKRDWEERMEKMKT